MKGSPAVLEHNCAHQIQFQNVDTLTNSAYSSDRHGSRDAQARVRDAACIVLFCFVFVLARLFFRLVDCCNAVRSDDHIL